VKTRPYQKSRPGGADAAVQIAGGSRSRGGFLRQQLLGLKRFAPARLRFYEVLRLAAEALEGKFPEAATLLYRRLAESVLDRGSSKQYLTPRAISNPARVSRRVCRRPDRLRHAAFVARLQKTHGRKYVFWGLMELKGR
jgi:hypothetical protein